MTTPGRFLVGLIGAGIGSSRSPALHEQEGRDLGLNLFYQLIDLERFGSAGIGRLSGLLNSAELMGFAGVNITHPCKQEVIGHLNELSPEAQAIGAVNTVLFSNGKRGHNTDWYGFAESFRRELPQVNLTTVVLIGAGGAGAAVSYAAMKLGVERMQIFDRDLAKAEVLVDKIGRLFGKGRATLIRDPAAALHYADGLIHATPTGMDGHPGIAISPDALRPQHWVAEVVYFPLETELLRQARLRGCRTMDGGGMAVLQAAKAFQLFTNVKPDEARMTAHFRGLYQTAKV